ncbi:MAG TPA: DUF2452 domain-containing protein [Chitinophagaceae bacterium]|nr:DUF2452 domain-containing protein [Chitinophagaceae bacterium]
MVQAYNFLGSWQLFPEKGNYEFGERPRSGTYKIEIVRGERTLQITHNWVSLSGQAFESQFTISANGEMHDFPDRSLADRVQARFADSINFEIHFYRDGIALLHVQHEIMPNGYLRLTQQGLRQDGPGYSNTEYYHRQLSVLPYSASVAGALIRPTEEGMIRHKALTAMEEQTNMQLEQIRRQIELLALQAQEIQKRKDLSMMIYEAKLNFKPNIGQVYYLYEKNDGSHILSLIAPGEWGKQGPFKRFVAAVRLLADHTWSELP